MRSAEEHQELMESLQKRIEQLEQGLIAPRRSKRLRLAEHGEDSVDLMKPGKGPGNKSSLNTALSDDDSSESSGSDFARPNKKKKKTARLRRKPSDDTDDDAGESPKLSADNATHRLAHKRTRGATESKPLNALLE